MSVPDLLWLEKDVGSVPEAWWTRVSSWAAPSRGIFHETSVFQTYLRSHWILESEELEVISAKIHEGIDDIYHDPAVLLMWLCHPKVGSLTGGFRRSRMGPCAFHLFAGNSGRQVHEVLSLSTYLDAQTDFCWEEHLITSFGDLQGVSWLVLLVVVFLESFGCREISEIKAELYLK